MDIIRRILFGKDFKDKTLWEMAVGVFCTAVLIFCIVRLYLIQDNEASFFSKLGLAVLKFFSIFAIPGLLYGIVVYTREENDRPLTHTTTTTYYSDGSKEVHTRSDSMWFAVVLGWFACGALLLWIYNATIAPMLWLKPVSVSIFYTKNEKHFFCDKTWCYFSLVTTEPGSNKNGLNGKNASQANASQPKKHKKKHKSN